MFVIAEDRSSELEGSLKKNIQNKIWKIKMEKSKTGCSRNMFYIYI